MRLKEVLKEYDYCDTIIIKSNQTGNEIKVKEYGVWIRNIETYPDYRTRTITSYGKDTAIIEIVDKNE